MGADSVLLVSHVRPDGDTLGSVLALYSVLRGLKKRVKLYNSSQNLPKHLNFLPNFNRINGKVDDFDLAVTCDCGSLDRTDLDLSGTKIVNIDHHKSNDYFGDINLVKPKMPSATFVVYKMLQKNDIPISKDVATCLYVGFLEDTGFFSYGNITKNSFKSVSKLLSCGIDIENIHVKLKQSLPLCVLRLRQHVYNSFNLHKNATIATAVVNAKDLKRTGCGMEDSVDTVNLLRELATVTLAILIIEINKNRYKISLRSKGNLDVSLLAKKFGGGGHMNAAGFEAKNLSPQQIIKNIIG